VLEVAGAKDDMPKVSVVTGFYNRAPALERTIASILGQTFRDIELVVFDDKSTDDTAARLEELSAQYGDPRFRYVIHEQNKGFVRGLRDAIETTDGEYIAIQGSGDVSLPRRLELQAALLDDQPDVAVVGGWYNNVIDDAGTRRLRTPDANQLMLEDFLRENCFSHGEVMIRRSVYNAVGGYRTAFKYAQDRDLWIRIAKVSRFATVPEAVYDRYVQFDGVSYVPSKIVSQACYSVAAARLAQLPPGDEAAALAQIEEHGPTALVGPDDPAVQKILTKGVARMVMFGDPRGGQELAQLYVRSAPRRRLLMGIARAYGSPLFKSVRPLVGRAAGIRK
jgi:hypothetical protein